MPVSSTKTVYFHPRGWKGMSTRWRSKRRPYRGRHMSLYKKIKAISLAQSETKTASKSENSISLYHNTTHYVTNLLESYQHVSANPGTSELYNRIGNEVVAKGLKLKLQLITSPSKPNQNARVIIFRYESNEVPNDGNFWVGPYGAGGGQNRMLDFADTRNVTVLREILIQNRNKLPYDAGNQPVQNVYRDVWIPLKSRKLKYDANNSGLPKYTTIGMAVVGYDANNTLATDIVQYLGYTSRFYFKDP